MNTLLAFSGCSMNKVKGCVKAISQPQSACSHAKVTVTLSITVCTSTWGEKNNTENYTVLVFQVRQIWHCGGIMKKLSWLLWCLLLLYNTVNYWIWKQSNKNLSDPLPVQLIGRRGKGRREARDRQSEICKTTYPTLLWSSSRPDLKVIVAVMEWCLTLWPFGVIRFSLLVVTHMLKFLFHQFKTHLAASNCFGHAIMTNEGE